MFRDDEMLQRVD